jgi:hypothetical protein
MSLTPCLPSLHLLLQSASMIVTWCFWCCLTPLYFWHTLLPMAWTYPLTPISFYASFIHLSLQLSERVSLLRALLVPWASPCCLISLPSHSSCVSGSPCLFILHCALSSMEGVLELVLLTVKFQCPPQCVHILCALYTSTRLKRKDWCGDPYWSCLMITSHLHWLMGNGLTVYLDPWFQVDTNQQKNLEFNEIPIFLKS